jgi:hypothetical protein
VSEHTQGSPQGGDTNPTIEVDSYEIGRQAAEAIGYGFADLNGGLPTSGGILAALSLTVLPKGSHLWLVDEGCRGVPVVALRSHYHDVDMVQVLTERGRWVTLNDKTNLRIGSGR